MNGDIPALVVAIGTRAPKEKSVSGFAKPRLATSVMLEIAKKCGRAGKDKNIPLGILQ